MLIAAPSPDHSGSPIEHSTRTVTLSPNPVPTRACRTDRNLCQRALCVRLYPTLTLAVAMVWNLPLAAPSIWRFRAGGCIDRTEFGRDETRIGVSTQVD